ncbi:MAG: DUF4126 family protein [Planctomycetota bacterium]|jgi:hypothetical protein
MDAILQGLGSIGFFASRAFLPAFMTALAMRVGPDLPLLADSDLLKSLPDAPTWFTAWPTILGLGVLALAEMLASKSPDARALLDEFDRWVKPAMSVLTFLGVTGAADSAFVEEALKEAGFLDWIPAAGVGLATFWLGSLRGSLMELLTESDEDDDAGVQGLVSWAEDLWAAAGPLLLVLFPIAMAVLVGLLSCGMILLRKRAEAKEEASKLPCAGCGAPTYRCALRCGACGVEVTEPAAVGFFGTSLPKPAPDREAHRYRLVEKKRCPVCATRLTERSPRQACKTCEHALFGEPDFLTRYLASVRGRLPLVLTVCLVCSLVPVVGLLPGVIYYRMALVAPFRRYIPRGRSLLMKWGMRLLFLVLVLVQWIPAVGGAVVPIMAVVNYVAWRRLFLVTQREQTA